MNSSEPLGIGVSPPLRSAFEAGDSSPFERHGHLVSVETHSRACMALRIGPLLLSQIVTELCRKPSTQGSPQGRIP